MEWLANSAIILTVFSFGSASIDFVNETSVVAIGATDLHFETINPIENNQETIQWTILLSSNDNQINLYFANYNFSSNETIDVIINEEYVLEAICGWYNETHFKSMLILGPMPAHLIEINFTMLVGDITHNENLTSTYCPDLNETEYLKVYNDTKAVYNQQARFNCSKGELYDGSSINPDYYRTCQFDATWSGEMPQCWIEPSATIFSPNELVSQQEVSFSCHVIDGYPDLFDASLSLNDSITTRSNVYLWDEITLTTRIIPEMNEQEIVCNVNNSYKETIEKIKINVLYGPVSDNEVLHGTIEYGKPLVVTLDFACNPHINKTTTYLVDALGSRLSEYEIKSTDEWNQMFEWKIANFTQEREGSYTFVAYSTLAPEVLIRVFELRGEQTILSTSHNLASTTFQNQMTSSTLDTTVPAVVIILAVLCGILVIAVIFLLLFIVATRKKTTTRERYLDRQTPETTVISENNQPEYINIGSSTLYQNP